MFIIIIYLVINQKKYSKNFDKETFALQPEDLSVIRNEINRVYDMDVEAIHNLGTISKSLLTSTNIFTASGTVDNATIPVDNIILKSGLTLENSTWEKTWNSSGKGSTIGYIVSDNDKHKTLMIVGNNTAGGPRKVTIWDNLVVMYYKFNNTSWSQSGITQGITVPQKWEKTEKKIGPTYINKSGSPIQVCVTIASNIYQVPSNISKAEFYLNGEILLTKTEKYGTIGFDIIVPNGASYSIIYNEAPKMWIDNYALVSWFELN